VTQGWRPGLWPAAPSGAGGRPLAGGATSRLRNGSCGPEMHATGGVSSGRYDCCELPPSCSQNGKSSGSSCTQVSELPPW